MAEAEAEGLPLSGYEGFKGLKESYEDRVVIEFLEGIGWFYGVFDGHGGTYVVEEATQRLPRLIESVARESRPDFQSTLEKIRVDARRRVVEVDRLLRPRKEEDSFVILGKLQEAAEDSETMIGQLEGLSYAGSFERVLDVKKQLKERRRLLDVVALETFGEADAGACLNKALQRKKRRLADRSHSEENARRYAVLTNSDEVWKNIARRAFERCDADILEVCERKNHKDGSTACVALLQGCKLVVSNLGDSRCLLCRNNKPVRCSRDHKPGDATEKRRVEQAGGYVVDLAGIQRATSAKGVGFKVDNASSLYLSVSRAFGDKQLKAPTAVISASPETKVFDLTRQDAFVVIACDGVFDVLSDERVIDIVRNKHPGDPRAAAKAIVNDAFANGSNDNITVIVVFFPWWASSNISSNSDEGKKVTAQHHNNDNNNSSFVDMFA